MMGIAPRPMLILVAFLLIPLIADSVFGQDQAGRYDILRGTNNESSCQLKDKIHSTCNSSITAPPLNVTPTASLCTCNKIFFNIWSACSYASGNYTLPVFSLWTSTCRNHSVNLAESASLSAFKGGLGIDIPVWAVPEVPGNTTFDLQQAVVLVHAPKPWSTLQIVTPLIAAVISSLITLFSASIYQRKNLGRVKWREEFVHRLRPPQKIKPVHHLRSEWEIDQESEHHEDPVNKGGEPFVFLDTSTTPLGQYTISGRGAVGRSRTSSTDAVLGNPSRSSESSAGTPRQRTAVGLSDAGSRMDTIPGHPSRHSESSGGTRDSTAVEGSGAGGGTDTIPGNPSLYSELPGGADVIHRPGVGRGYPFGPSHQVQARHPLIPVRQLPSTTESELNTNRGWRFPGSGSFKGMLLRPWKRVPGKLVEVQPTKRFRVDPSSPGSGIGHSTIGSETTRDSGVTSSYPRRSSDIADHLEGESDSLDYHDYNRDGDVASDDEGTNLISLEEKEQRKSGITATSLATISTDPNINIVSPTVSSSSPRSTRIVGPSPSKTDVRAAVPVIPPIIPPPPTQPAPAVPANMFRRALQRRRDNNIELLTNQQPLIFPDRLTMTPIQEVGSEEGMSSIRRSPSPIPTRSNSNDQQDASGPPHSVPKSSSSDELQRPSPSPAPSISGQALPYYLRANQRAPSPTPSLHEHLTNGSPIIKAKALLPGPSRLLPFEPVSSPMYFHQRSASSSASVTRNHDDILGDPLLSKPPIRRGMSADDLNLTLVPLSATPPLRIGSPRLQVGRDSASELFPSSVRSAGYRGIPNF